jgi:hypothetical protein
VDDPDEHVKVELTALERTMLRIGLTDWDGPNSCGDAMAQVLGFHDVEDLLDEGHRLGVAIAAGEALSRRDWTRALASLEIMLSEVLGSGEWGAIHGYDEDELHVALLPLRRKLPTSKQYLPRLPRRRFET